MATKSTAGPDRLGSRLGLSLLTLILAAVLPIAVGISVLVVLLQQEVRQSKEQEILGVVRALSATTDAELMATMRFAEALAADPIVAQGDWTRFDSKARGILATQPQLAGIVVTDLATATYLVHTELPPGTTAAAGPVTMEQSRLVAETGKTTIFGVRPTGPTQPAPIIPIRAPIFSDGQVTQTVSVSFSPIYLSGIYSRSNFGENRTGAIIDPTLLIAARNRTPEQFIGRKITPQLENAIRSGSEGIFDSVNQEGQRVYSVFSRSATTGWISVAGLPGSEIDGQFRKVILPLIVGGFLAAVVGIGIAAYIANRIRLAHQAETRFSESLEKLVDERTAELDVRMQQLHRAQKMEAVGQLTGGVAHDFNNLLGVVVGNLDIAETMIDGAHQARPFIRTALDGALRGGEVIKQLLSFSRSQILTPAIVDINEILGRMEGLIDRAVGESVTLELSVGTDLWPVKVDPAQFESAVLNLAINARDAMPAGGTLKMEAKNVHLGKGYVELHPDVAGGDYVCVSVSDTGTGMPPEIVERVFEPFFTTKEQGKGTGLGLSMVYGFVKQSGGHVAIYSEVGYGTTVKIYLPRAQASERSDADANGPESPLPRGTETVLLVEDNPGMRAIAERQLMSLGYRVRTVANGAEALALLDSGERVDLLFSDIVMPGGMTGLELADEASRRRPEIGVLMTTGFHGDTMRGGAVKRRILTKPYRIADLARAVREALDGKAGPS